MKLVYNGEKDSRMFKDMIGRTIEEIMAEDPAVVWLDSDLMGCSGTNKQFGKSDRYINCGIAEANMVGIGCGMSAVGWKPYAHTFGTFASRRCFDQAFLSGGYAGNAITIIGTDPGITAAFNGGTHMPFEDVALYRTIPNAVIVDITDVPMLVDTLKKAKDLPGVKYIRVPRKDSRQVYADGTEFTVGKGNVLREGKLLREGLEKIQMLRKDYNALQSAEDASLQFAIQVYHALRTAEALLLAMISREESRGSHFRSDFPNRVPDWEGKRLVLNERDGALKVECI